MNELELLNVTGHLLISIVLTEIKQFSERHDP